MVVYEFHSLLSNFEISAPNDKSQLILILQPCLEQSNAHLTVATDCAVYISARSKRKVGDLGKLKATELHLIVTQKLLREFTGLSTRNVDRGVCVTELHAINR
jgi:hypothetical protein